MATIRAEVAEDHDAIRAVHLAAFGRPAEASLVEALRRGEGFDARLSLVYVSDAAIVGHILLSPINIGTAGALALAPLAVKPDHQRRGYGSALIEAGLHAARKLGHQVVVVLGHSEYYPRFGFRSASQYGITAPFEVPSEAFLVCELAPGALQGKTGVVNYPAPFFEV